MRRSARYFFVTTAVLALAGSSVLAAQQEPPDTVVFTRSRMGVVTFSHLQHAGPGSCAVCHHESRPQKPATGENQPCSACHTQTPTAPMVTGLRDVYHDARATTGVCITCHAQAREDGNTTVPVRCNECHVRQPAG